MKYVLNAFSLNMVAAKFPCMIVVEEVSTEVAAGYVEVGMKDGMLSGVGHADTAAVFTSVLGTTVPMNRITVNLSEGDSVLVGQYVGPRLPEGATTLPEGATIKWLEVTVTKPGW